MEPSTMENPKTIMPVSGVFLIAIPILITVVPKTQPAV
jgi:hypothetical protein